MLELYDLRRTQERVPAFSWRLKGDCGQAGYQITVKDDLGGTVWDSGFIKRPERHNIRCGVPLAVGGHYTWTLRCLGTDGAEATEEGPAFFSEIPQWKAEWVEPARTRKPLTDSMDPFHCEPNQSDPVERLDSPVYLRKEYRLKARPDNAICYVTARGNYALWVNGQKVSDLLSPGYTSYGERLEYQCHDIVPLLKAGENVIGVVLADGWFTGKISAAGVGEQFGKENALLLQINCHYADGSDEMLATDGGFRWMVGAWRYADLFVGEYYDAALEVTGWLEAGFDVSEWQPVVVQPYGYRQLSLQSIEPVQVLRTIQPVVRRTPQGDLLLDAGETIVGYTSFSVMMQKGDVITLEHSETVDAQGNFLQNILGQNKQQTDRYRCGRDGLCVWEPVFTFHGFRYVRVTGTTDCDPAHYCIHVIGTPLEQTGFFACSDERLNRLQQNILRSQQGNMICIPTDCPQRERTGWTGDMQVYAPTACYEMDVEQFLHHWLVDMEAEQLEDGQVPHIIPLNPSHSLYQPPGSSGVSAAGWSDAAVILPWRLYEAYGDLQLLETFFPMMKRYMDSTGKRVAELPAGSENMPPEQLERQKYLWNTDFQFGDWLMPSAPGPESARLTGYPVATLMYAYTTKLMAEICTALDKRELCAHYLEVNKRVREAFAQEYINSDGTLTADYQGVYILALAMDAVPQALRPAALARLEELIHQNEDRLATGFLSIPFLLPVLHDQGRGALANRLLFQDRRPSWLYEVKMGATTIWESWDAYAEDGTPSTYSMNHFAFGCVGEYLFRTILGLRHKTPGYSQVIIEPDLGCGLTDAQGAFESIWGRIEIAWRTFGRKAVLDIVLPPDVKAEVIFGSTHAECTCGHWHLETDVDAFC